MDVRTLPTHPGTGLTAIGFVGGRPVWPVAGAAEPAEGDDSDGDGEDSEEGTDDGDGDGTESDEWTPPTREELEAERAAAAAKIKRANEQAKRLRVQLNAAAPAAPTKAAPVAKKAAPTKPEPAEEAAAVVDDGELERWQVRAIRADAKAALLAQGCDPELIDAPLSRLNPTDIDWDGEDPLLEDWVEEMKERYPKAFAKSTSAPAPKPGLRRAPSIDQGAGTGTNGQTTRKRPSLGETLIAAGGGLTSDGRLPGRGRR